MIENPNVICNDCGFGKQNKELKEKCERLEKQLEIAVEALDFFASVYDWNTPLTEDAVENVAEDYLKQIKELEK